MKANNSPWLGRGRIILTLLACILLAGIAHAQSLSLLTPSIANVNGALTASFGVDVMNLPAVKGELEDGIVLKLKCEADLYETMDYWLDSNLSHASFESLLSYDSLANEFVMTVPGRETPFRDKDVVQLLKKGWSHIETVLGPWNLLERGEKYSLRIQTSLREADAPEGLTRFVYFWSWESGASATFLLNFTY